MQGVLHRYRCNFSEKTSVFSITINLYVLNFLLKPRLYNDLYIDDDYIALKYKVFMSVRKLLTHIHTNTSIFNPVAEYCA